MRKKAGNCLCFAAITTLVPTLALATGGEMELESPFTLLMRLVNFLLLAALLYYFLRKPIKNFLVQRQQGVREALEEAQRAAKEAEARYKEMEKKLAQAHKEMEELKNMIIEQGKQEKERILARAHEEAERIIKQAELAAEQELKKAYSSIRLEAVEMAAAIAEAILKDKIDSKDHKRLIEQYVENVGKMTS